ncbi:MAG: peptidoglycan-binding protein [Stigonema ocellatum SAG 48.90 = DSM 106950]|nr:peptidoglycan-binding protein [Stigonema ocellatum SAG 48.90 = DSM 106950]
MEYFAYSHMVLANTEANPDTEFSLPETKLKFSWKKHLKSAWLTFTSISALAIVLTQAQIASATYYGPSSRYFVNTNGSSLLVRSYASVSAPVVEQYSNGQRLPRVIGYRNGFAQLSNGYYVAARWIGSTPGSGNISGPGVGGQSYLSIGSTGQLVSQLQQRLGISPTGYYDYRTSGAVRRYQSSVGLTADGVAGPITINSLFS